jgi:hypothetical protein
MCHREPVPEVYSRGNFARKMPATRLLSDTGLRKGGMVLRL